MDERQFADHHGKQGDLREDSEVGFLAHALPSRHTPIKQVCRNGNLETFASQLKKMCEARNTSEDIAQTSAVLSRWQKPTPERVSTNLFPDVSVGQSRASQKGENLRFSPLVHLRKEKADLSPLAVRLDRVRLVQSGPKMTRRPRSWRVAAKLCHACRHSRASLVAANAFSLSLSFQTR